MCETDECPVCDGTMCFVGTYTGPYNIRKDTFVQCNRCGFVNDGVRRNQDTLDFLRRCYEVRVKAGWSK